MRKKLSVLGLSSAMILSIFLSACSNEASNESDSKEPGKKEKVTIEYAAGADASGYLAGAIEEFNATHENIQVKYTEMPQTPNDQLTRYSTWFNSESATPDLFMMDVIWPKMFASAGWLEPLDKYVDEDYLSQFWPAATEVAQMDGKQYGIQGYIDVGMLYYRKDLLEKYNQPVPTTWEELAAVSKEILSKENNPNLTGYVYQGAKIEGATINWLEFLWGLGGDVFDADGKLNVNTKEGIGALETMSNLIYKDKVSPVSVSTSNPNDNMIVFSSGNAIFMRQWPGSYSNLKGTVVEGKYDVAPIPHHEGFESHPSTGGWIYGINSKSKHKDEAAEVMKFFLSTEQQKKASLTASRISSIRTVFEDQEVLTSNPIFEKLPAFLEQAKSRPALRAYETFSRAVQTQINLVLSGEKDAETAMKDAQKEIDDKLKE
jgi:multiple sugar transport system substrate-binding protein